MTESTAKPSQAIPNTLPNYLENLTQEVRIAIVMFGGVSLAVYMNGIAQELLKAVRATAPSDATEQSAPADSTLKSTERVYRQIGKILHHGRLAKCDHNEIDYASVPIRTRIIIDILSGTSAGGINAVFLAKALANDQGLDQIHNIWLHEGNIDTLLNDGKSQPSSYPSATPKTSLLNSQRMFGKLLEAFEGMDATVSRQKNYETRLAKEIDLFVTTTDLNGISLPIQLANTVIDERMHKARFHFAYRGTSSSGATFRPNDFLQDYNPMLAFASRCTSSFPGAFEPMKFSDVDFILPGISTAVFNDEGHPFRKFFQEFVRFGAPAADRPLGVTRLPFTKRPLADGGYLNNKPFSFAIDTIRFRGSHLPVRRKLLFLDPFPELKSTLEEQRSDFNFVENSVLAASALPRYQTIREDIERLNSHNRQIRKAQMLLQEVEQDLPKLVEECLTKRRPEKSRNFQGSSLDGLIKLYGQCYVTYHRLCVSATTDDLTLLFTRLFGFNEDSDALYAIRMLIHAWRQDTYSAQGEGDKKTETDFLWTFDLGYRIRRLEYLRDEIDKASGLASRANGGQKVLQEFLAAADNAIILDANGTKKFAGDLRKFRAAAIQARQELATRREQLWVESDPLAQDPETKRMRDELRNALAPARLDYSDLQWILSPVTDDESQQRASTLYRTGMRGADNLEMRPVRKAFQDAARILADDLSQALTAPSRIFLNAVNPAGDPKGQNDAEARLKGPAPSETAARYLWIRYKFFECRDVIVFSLMPDKLTGEGTWTEVYRISPADSVGVLPPGDDRANHKLAGTALGAFGAFLDEGWRENDILWGRLDGAERIIVSLLPDDDDRLLRSRLIQEAAQIILDEDFSPHRCADVVKPLLAYIWSQLEKKGHKKSDKLTADEFLELAGSEISANCPAVVNALLTAIQGNPDRLTVFRQFYSMPAGAPVEVSLRRIRRASRIFGDMLRGLDGGQGIPTKFGGWVAQAASVATRFIEFSMPGTLAHVLQRHWLQLLYLSEALLIAVGAVGIYPEAETPGWIAFCLTTLAHLVSWIVGRVMRSRRWKGRVIVVSAALLAVLLGTTTILFLKYHIPLRAWKTPLHTLIDLIAKALSK
jgi:patatin-related protein